MRQAGAHCHGLNRRRGEFRWSIIWVLLVFFLVAWMAAGARPSITWNDVLDFLHVTHREAYSSLCILALTLCSILAIARVLGYGRKKD